MDIPIYALVLRRLAEVDHGWGKPYDFQALYVLNCAVPNAGEPGADPNQLLGQEFNEALKSALLALLAELPTLTFVHNFYDVYDGSQQGPNQIRNGGGIIELGPPHGTIHTAVVEAMFYGGHRWARWIRYHLERIEDAWHISSSRVLAVS